MRLPPRRVLALAALGVGLLVMPGYVSGTSMTPAIADGSPVLTELVGPRLGLLHRGDIVSFLAFEPIDGKGFLVKRIIGLPGETIVVSGARVCIDGRPLAEPYLIEHMRSPYFSGEGEPIRIPEGSVFLMGDERRTSKDSRLFGPVPLARVVARVYATVRASTVDPINWIEEPKECPPV